MSLLPWTDPFYALLPVVPTLLLFSISSAILLLGIIMYLTGTDFSLDDILLLFPRITLSVRRRLNKKKIFGFTFIILGILGAVTFGDRAYAESQTTSGGGSPANACTPSNGLCPPGTDLQNFQHGSVSVTIAANAAQAGQAVTFSPAFTSAPIPPNGNVILRHPAFPSVVIPGAAFTFQGPGNNTEVWTSMPAAQTELYGFTNPCCRLFQPQAWNILGNCRFEVNVLTASTSATAQLQVQTSPDQTTWSNSGNLVVGVSGAGLQISPSVTPDTTFNSYVRVTGLNGNGAGDSPQFGLIAILCNYQLIGGDIAATSITKTGFTIGVSRLAIQTASTTITVTWTAYLCPQGSSNC